MSDLKPFGEVTVQPVQKTTYSAEFDPVLEIRKLRQNLTHRIQVLQPHTTTVPIFLHNSPVSNGKENKVQENTEKSEKEETTAVVETIEVVKEIDTNPLFPATTEDETEKNRIPELEFPANELIQQIHQARQLLAQLQITPYENNPSPDEPHNKPLSKTEENKPENVTVSKTEPLEIPERFFPSLAVLKMMNTVLVWCGLLGILFSLQYLEHDSRFGLTIIGAGLILITVGLLGRFCSFTFHKKSPG
ncbi:MAG: hypothetical protein LBK82_10855 [Planctomycetaceae bacterium]|jgi:hypothetical protein|nr:hypothetical protein [Planctomycetaceae bacterium]